MVQFLSINFFSWISSIFVGFFKNSRFFCVTLYIETDLSENKRVNRALHLVMQKDNIISENVNSPNGTRNFYI